MGEAVEVERGDELVDRQDLLAAGRRPAEQRDVVHERLAQVALGDERLDRDGTVTLRELGSGRGIDDQREVRVDGRLRCSERPSEREHPVRRVEQVLAADHVRDAHVDVVDGVGEEEDRRVVGALDHEVRDPDPLDPDLATEEVVERADALVGRTEADD